MHPLLRLGPLPNWHHFDAAPLPHLALMLSRPFQLSFDQSLPHQLPLARQPVSLRLQPLFVVLAHPSTPFGHQLAVALRR